MGMFNSYLCFAKVDSEQMHVKFCAPLNREPITSSIPKDFISNGASFLSSSVED